MNGSQVCEEFEKLQTEMNEMKMKMLEMMGKMDKVEMSDNTVTEDHKYHTEEEMKQMGANIPEIQLITMEKTNHKLNVGDLIKITEKQTLEIRNLKYQLQDKDFEIQKLQFEDTQNARSIKILWTRLKEYKAKLKDVMTNEVKIDNDNMPPTKESVKYVEQNVIETLIEKLELLEEKVYKMDEKIENTNQLVINNDFSHKIENLNSAYKEIDKKISDMDKKIINVNEVSAKTDIDLQNVSLMFEKQKDATEEKLQIIDQRTENTNKSLTEQNKVYDEKFGSLQTALTNNIEKTIAAKDFVTGANLGQSIQMFNVTLNEKYQEFNNLKKMTNDLDKTVKDFDSKPKIFGDEISEMKGKSMKKTNNKECKHQLIIPGLKDVILNCNSSSNWMPCKTLLEEKLKKDSSIYCELKKLGNSFQPIEFALRGCTHMIAVLLANDLPINQARGTILRQNEYLDCKGTLSADHRYRYTEYTLLHCAVENHHLNLVEYLLSKGADMEIRQCNGKTALHLAVEFGYLDIVKLLVENSCDINAKDMNLKSPLHIAAQKSLTKVVEYLVKSGCNVNVRDSEGKTASDVAKSIEVKSILTSL